MPNSLPKYPNVQGCYFTGALNRCIKKYNPQSTQYEKDEQERRTTKEKE